MYTSGTTGRPKGAMRSQAGDSLLHAATARTMAFSADDTGLLVMPMCHANSFWFSFTFPSCGGTAFVYSRKSFDLEHLLRTLSEQHISFTSLVPTHYTMMLGLPAAVKAKYNVDGTDKLLISSAPARRDTKLAILEHFRNSKLFEGYGSTEAGWVTILPPEEQLHKLGSIGRELAGTGPIKLLDPNGKEVPGGEVGELYFRTPYVFQGYWNMPEKTAAAFRGEYCSVGDMARRDEDGYYFLVDRKSNMIISGGENVPRRWKACSAASQNCARWPSSACPMTNGGKRFMPLLSYATGKRRAKAKCWTGVRIKSRDISDRDRCPSSRRRKSQGPRPARSSIVFCGSATPTPLCRAPKYVASLKCRILELKKFLVHSP
jgi:hypothetical protein